MKRISFKTAALSTLALTLFTTGAFAAPTMVRPAEVRSRIERDLKRFETAKIDAARLENTLRQSMLYLAAGKLSTRDVDAALKKTFEAKEDGTAYKVDLTEMAKSIEATRNTLDRLEVAQKESREQLDPETAQLVTELKRGLEITPRFLALAALTTRGKNEAHVEAFAKELSLIKDILSSMKTEEMRSHLDVMEMALTLKLRSPELAGDQVFVTALKDKYGAEKANEVLESLRRCVR